MGASGLNIKKLRGEDYYKGFIVLLSSFLVAFITAGILAPVESSDAITCTSGNTGTEGEICSTAGTDVSVTIEKTVYSISVTSSHGSSDTPVSMSYTADSGNKLGDVVVASDTVTTTTNSPLDHYLYISTNSSSNKLTNEDSIDSNPKTYIAPGGGDNLVSATTLSNDTWGFALPSTTSGIPTNSFDDSYTSDSISSSSKFTKVPVLDNDILVQKEVGIVDEDTGLNTSVADVYYGAKATSNLFAGTYSNTIKYTVYTEVPPDEETRTIEDITYMQEINKAICDNTPESTTYNQYTLKDKRGRGNGGSNDGTYTIVKAKDGNCWMSENFDLYNKEISAADSDFSNSSYKIPDSSNYVLSEANIKPKVHAASSSLNGVYYNWTSSVALMDGTSTTSFIDQSICPKNWQLPINSDFSEKPNKSYARLLGLYNVTSGTNVVDSSRQSRILGFSRYYGYYYPGIGEIGQGTNGIFWTATATSIDRAYALEYRSDGVLRQLNDPRASGWSLRCVSRD